MEQSLKTKENNVIMILSNLVYITPIRLSFCISPMRRSLLVRGGERENFLKRKKITKSVRNDFKVKQMIKNA